MDLVTPIIGSFFLQPSITVIWRTAAAGGPPFTDWTQVNVNGFGDANNVVAWSIAVYNGKLYVGTENSPTGAEVWETGGVGGPPYTDWTQANTDGFGEGSSHTAYIMIVYNGFLYASASNGGPATPGVRLWRAMTDASGPVTSNTSATPNPTSCALTVTLTATMNDATTGNNTIQAAEYWIDPPLVIANGNGTPMAASDGAFDEITEGVTAQINLGGISSGMHTIMVHG